MLKKLKRKIRLKLAYWHRKRANELLAKVLGAKYYLQFKTQLSSFYGINASTNIYADTDSVKED